MKPTRVVIDFGTDTAIEVDATLTEKHSAQVELTKYPVESGVSPTDHSREAPEKVTIEGVVSNTPIGAIDRLNFGLPTSIQQQGKTLQQLLAGDSGPGGPGQPGRRAEVLDALRALKSARRAVVVKGPLRTYESMVMTQLDYSRDSKLGDALKFSCTFEQVRFVQTSRTQLRPAATTTAVPHKTATEKTDQGAQPTAPVSKAELAKILDSIPPETLPKWLQELQKP